MHIEGFSSYSKFKSSYFTHRREPFFEIALRYCRLTGKEDPVIVDIGSGQGDFFNYCKEKNFPARKLFLLDANPKTVKSNKATLTENSLEYMAPDRLPFEDKSVDVVHTSHMIEYLSPEKMHALMLEMNRVLEDGGYLVISAPMLWSNLYNDLGHLRPSQHLAGRQIGGIVMLHAQRNEKDEKETKENGKSDQTLCNSRIGILDTQGGIKPNDSRCHDRGAKFSLGG